MSSAAGFGPPSPSDLVDITDIGGQPAHDAFEGRNVWSLFNAFTEALKGNLLELPRRTEALHGLLDNHVGLSA